MPETDIFDEIAGAKVTQRSGKSRAGKYTFVLRNLKRIKPRKGGGSTAMVFELVVTKATAIKKDVEPNEVGSSIGHFACFYGNAADVAPSVVKEGVCALFNENVNTIDKSELKSTLSDLFCEKGEKDQPCRGFMLQGETSEGSNGRDFLHLSPVDPSFNDSALIAKRRAELEAGGDLSELTVSAEEAD